MEASLDTRGRWDSRSDPRSVSRMDPRIDPRTDASAAPSGTWSLGNDSALCAGIIPLHVGSSGNVRVLILRLSNGVECLPRAHMPPHVLHHLYMRPRSASPRSASAAAHGMSEALRDTAARALWHDTGYAVTAWLDAPALGFECFAGTPGAPGAATTHFFPALVEGRTQTDRRVEIASARWHDVEFCPVTLTRNEQDAIRLARQSAVRRASASAPAPAPSMSAWRGAPSCLFSA